MAINTVVTRGFGNGTFSGTIALVATRGYSIAESIIVGDGSAVLNIHGIMTDAAINVLGQISDTAVNIVGRMSQAAINIRARLYRE